ncbi:MAG: hypothetical protein ACOCW3_02360 [Spirochaetota bacterium]
MSILRSFRFPEKDLQRLKEIADQHHGGNQTQTLMEALERYHRELSPVSVEGYIRLDRVAAADDSPSCPVCGASRGARPWVAIRSDGTLKGLLCDACVKAGRS